ncbi:aldolase [Hortaea werneckii]|nr:aldolase [Hortaea werneckii]
MQNVESGGKAFSSPEGFGFPDSHTSVGLLVRSSIKLGPEGIQVSFPATRLNLRSLKCLVAPETPHLEPATARSRQQQHKRKLKSRSFVLHSLRRTNQNEQHSSSTFDLIEMAIGSTNGASNGATNGHSGRVGFDMAGLTPAPVTPFTPDGAVDYEAIQRLGSWLGSIQDVKGLVVLGHAGEGTFLTQQEQVDVIKAFVKSVNNQVPIIAGITGEGTEVAAEEAKRAKEAGAQAGLLYPSHGWLRFGYQPGAPQDRYRRVYEHSGLPLILFQYPDATKATYSLQTMLDIAALPGVFAMKNGVRNMKRWDTEIPVIRRERPELQILTCHDEYLLHTAFDVDGMLVGYGNIAPEPLIEMIKAGKARDYPRARAIHDQLLPVTKSVYHRGSHMEGTVALKHALVARGILSHATVRDSCGDEICPAAKGCIELGSAYRISMFSVDGRSAWISEYCITIITHVCRNFHRCNLLLTATAPPFVSSLSAMVAYWLLPSWNFMITAIFFSSSTSPASRSSSTFVASLLAAPALPFASALFVAFRTLSPSVSTICSSPTYPLTSQSTTPDTGLAIIFLLPPASEPMNSSGSTTSKMSYLPDEASAAVRWRARVNLLAIFIHLVFGNSLTAILLSDNHQVAFNHFVAKCFPTLSDDGVPHQALIGVDIHKAQVTLDLHQRTLPIRGLYQSTRLLVALGQELHDSSLGLEPSRQSGHDLSSGGFPLAPLADGISTIDVILWHFTIAVGLLIFWQKMVGVPKDEIDSAFQVVLQYLQTDGMGARAECAKALETVIVQIAFLSKRLPCLSDGCFDLLQSLLVSKICLTLDVHIAQPADYPAFGTSVQAGKSFGPYAKDSHALYCNASPILGTRELKVLDRNFELGGNEIEHLHGILVLLVQSEVEVLASQLAPAELALDEGTVDVPRGRLVATRSPGRLSRRCFNCNDASLVLHRLRLKLGGKDAANGNIEW